MPRRSIKSLEVREEPDHIEAHAPSVARWLRLVYPAAALRADRGRDTSPMLRTGEEKQVRLFVSSPVLANAGMGEVPNAPRRKPGGKLDDNV